MGTEIISMCHREHLDVWRRTSFLMTMFLISERMLVYVPERDVNLFRDASNSRTLVLPQESLSEDYLKDLRAAVYGAGSGNRLGWYRQQYDKIEALTRGEEDLLVIWDADCVPVSPQSFVDQSGRLRYMSATEFHPEYFRMIDRLLGLERVRDGSFVIPGFPIRREWVGQFIDEVTDRHDVRHWSSALIGTTDFGQVGAFSETETLGTWIAHRHPDEWINVDVSWERYGRSRFGKIQRFTPQDLTRLAELHAIDIISFENWDRRTLSWWARYLRNRLRNPRSPGPVLSTSPPLGRKKFPQSAELDE